LHNPYNEYKSDAHARQLQCVFLYNICNEEYDVIYQLVSFAIQRNTMRIYAKNIILLEEAKDFFSLKNIKKPKYNNIEFVTYIIIFNNEFLKIGKTNNLERRIKEELKQYKTSNYELVKKYSFNSPWLANAFECLVQNYFYKKISNYYIPNDRFMTNYITKEELNYIDNLYINFKKDYD